MLEDDEMDVDAPTAAERESTDVGATEPPTEPPTEDEERTARVTVEELNSIRLQLIIELRRQEEGGSTGGRGRGWFDVKGLKESQLVDWYLEQLDTTSEAELNYQRRVIRGVIKYLVKKEKVLVEVVPMAEGEESLFTLHPSYSTD